MGGGLRPGYPLSDPISRKLARPDPVPTDPASKKGPTATEELVAFGVLVALDHNHHIC